MSGFLPRARWHWVALTTSARPELTLRGRLAYIDPQVSADTRTAKARFEVPNPGGGLRLGMYALSPAE